MPTKFRRSAGLEGVYRSESGMSFKVYFTVWERDRRGHKHRRQRTKNFSHKHDRDYPEGDALEAAIAFKEKMDAALRAGSVSHADEVITVSDAFDRFMRAKERRPTTERLYAGTFQKWIAPTLGAWLVADLDPQAVEEWAAGIDAKPGARRQAVSLLRAVLEQATRHGLIPSNPSRVVSPGQPPVRSIRPDEIPTPEQVAALADAVGDHYRSLIFLLAYGGLRIGEAVALRVDRVDFLRRRITIDQTLSEVRGGIVFGPPKTSAGNRTITAPAFLIELLAHQVEAFPTTTGLVFSAPEGGELRPGNFRRRMFDPAARSAGLAGLHIHDLRHCAASQLAADGGTAVEIAARLGHANAALTQRVYTHLLESRDHRLAELQEERFRQRR